MRLSTSLVHLGRNSAEYSRTVNPPLVRASTIVSPSLEAYKTGYTGIAFENSRYGRSGTSTTFEFQRMMAALAGTESCIATSCGLSAIITVLSTFAAIGRRILVSAGVYGPTRVFCDKELKAIGTSVDYFADPEELQKLMGSDVSLIFVETPASLTMEMFDLRRVCEIGRAAGVPIAADTTWGTPIFFDPHKLGVNISIQAATKYINGHSDVMLGAITGTFADLAAVREYCDRSGVHAAPDAC